MSEQRIQDLLAGADKTRQEAPASCRGKFIYEALKQIPNKEQAIDCLLALTEKFLKEQHSP